MQSNSLFCEIQLSLHEIPNSIMISLFHLCEIISGRPKIQGIFYLRNQQWQTINSQNFLYAKSDYLETYYFAKSIVVDHKFKEFSISEIKSLKTMAYFAIRKILRIYGLPNLILMILQQQVENSFHLKQKKMISQIKKY